MRKAQRDQTKCEEQKRPLPYRTPRLVKYGTVPELTAAGSLGVPESVSNSGSKVRP